jgi:uncharacterized integral membrane protein (TIGR00698 family)
MLTARSGQVLVSIGTKFKIHVPGILICTLIALSATFVSENYGGPQLLYALLIGLSLHFLSQQTVNTVGINFCARFVLRFGVAMLGMRITLEQVTHLGAHVGLVLLLAVCITISTGLLLAKAFGRPASEGLLSGGAVGICGASAAMAISSVLPPTRDNERFTLMSVVGVTVLSTLAMVAYPLFLNWVSVPAVQSGIFLGGTIHDVAQVVAAGMMMGQESGDAATVVKLFRVVLLLPVVMLIAFCYRQWGNSNEASQVNQKSPALIPGFLIGFMALVILASSGWVPTVVTEMANSVSRWCLVIAIAAAGVKTSLGELAQLGWQPVLMLVTETLVIACFMFCAIYFLNIGQN